MQASADLPAALANGGTTQAAVAYWQHELADAPLLLQLPVDLPRPTVPTGRVGTVQLQLTAALALAARGAAEAEGSLLFDVLLAAWQALLQRYSRADEIVTGALLASCSRGGLQRLNGASAHLVPIRTDLTGAQSVSAPHFC